MSDAKFNKLIVIVAAGMPLVMLGWDAWHGQLGVNSVNYAIRTTGLMALIFLTLSLVVTPLRRVTGWNSLINYRRALGLYGFFYALIHFCIYFVLDRALSIQSTFHEIVTRTYLQIGMGALLLMVPLAITSTDGMIRRLGARRWKRLHRLAYLATLGGGVHYFLLVKADVRQPIAFLIAISVLLVARFVFHYLDLRKLAHRAMTVPSVAANQKRSKFWAGKLRVARTFDETPSVRTFRLVATDGGPLPFEHQAGQYLNLKLMVDGKRVNRSYTIASAPTQRAYCELTVKREEMGVSSGHLHRQIHAGDFLDLSAPAGRFVFEGGNVPGVIFVAGGVGITPVMSMTRALCDRGWPGQIHFFFAIRNPQEFIFREELDRLVKRFDNLHLHLTLTGKDAEQWSGDRGRPTAQWISQHVRDCRSLPIYICGPQAMMDDLQQQLNTIEVPEANVHVEAFVSPGSQVAEADSPSASTSVESADEVEREMMPVTATFSGSDKSAVIDSDISLLEVAEMAGVDIPFECRSGICGQCKVKLSSGSVQMDSEDALSASEKKSGWILACQSHAKSDLVVEA